MKKYYNSIITGCIISATICFCTWLNNIINWKNLYSEKVMGYNDNHIFLILAVIFVLAVTLIILKEKRNSDD